MDIVELFRKAHQKQQDAAILNRGLRMLEAALKAESLTNVEKNTLAAIAGVYARQYPSLNSVTDHHLLGLVFAIYAVGYGQGFNIGKLEALKLIGRYDR